MESRKKSIAAGIVAAAIAAIGIVCVVLKRKDG